MKYKIHEKVEIFSHPTKDQIINSIIGFDLYLKNNYEKYHAKN